MNSDYIKQKAREFGADLVGIGDIAGFSGTMPQRDPRQILPNATCVIGFAFRVPRALYQAMEDRAQFFNYTQLGVKFLDEEFAEIFLLKMAGIIENEGFDACVQRNVSNLRIQGDKTTNPEVIDTYELALAEPVAPGKPAPEIILDFNQAAQVCGLGTAGRSGQLITPQFGPFVRTAFLITDAPLECDVPFTDNLCDDCGLCANACPGHAISELGTDSWQCAVYYRGAHKSNPFQNDDFLKNDPNRTAIRDGSFRFDAASARAIYPKLDFLPSRATGYAPCLCGKACSQACAKHLRTLSLLNPSKDPSKDSLKDSIKDSIKDPSKDSIKDSIKDSSKAIGVPVVHTDSATLKRQIVETLAALGADLVRFGNANRFVDPAVRKLFPAAKTVIGIVCRQLRGVRRGIEEGSTYYQYTTCGVETIEETILPSLLLKGCAILEDAGFDALPQRKNQTIMSESDSTNPEVDYRDVYRGCQAETTLDFNRCAVDAGLGELGLSGSLLTDDFGPFQRFAFILTDAEIEPDPIVAPHLCDQCGKCVAGCPGHAISPDGTLNRWQCSAYYIGANRSRNPFMPRDAFADEPDRLAIISGEANLNPERAKEIIDQIVYYPPIKHSYWSSICGRTCDTECYIHLEQKGVLNKKFSEPFRKREKWELPDEE